MEEIIKSEIQEQKEEIKHAEERFNERLYANPIGLFAYDSAMARLSCSSEKPSEAAHKFYDIYRRIFNFAKVIRKEHPEYSKDILSKNLEKFCIEDETIRSYITSHLHIPSSDAVLRYAHNVVDMYITLDHLGFTKIVESEENIRKKSDELASMNAVVVCIDESVSGIAKNLVNVGFKKMLKVARIISDTKN